MKYMLLLSCAAGAALLLGHPRQPQAAPSGPQPPSAALQEAMSSHGIEVGTAGSSSGVSFQPVAYTQASTP